jgi:hypothetical protein
MRTGQCIVFQCQLFLIGIFPIMARLPLSILIHYALVIIYAKHDVPSVGSQRTDIH